MRSLAFAVFALLGLTCAAATDHPPLLTVSGSAEIKVAPDEIDLKVGVESRGSDVTAVRAANDAIVQRALKFLADAGVPRSNISTDHISAEPHFYPKEEPSLTIRKSIQIRLTDVGSFETVLSGLLESGITHVHGVHFRTSQLRKLRDRARADAVKAAREKADDLAAALGVKRGRVHSVDALDWGGWWGWSGGGSYWGNVSSSPVANNISSSQSPGNMSGDPGSTFSTGEISVSASVNVAFTIVE